MPVLCGTSHMTREQCGRFARPPVSPVRARSVLFLQQHEGAVLAAHRQIELAIVVEIGHANPPKVGSTGKTPTGN